MKKKQYLRVHWQKIAQQARKIAQTYVSAPFARFSNYAFGTLNQVQIYLSSWFEKMQKTLLVDAVIKSDNLLTWGQREVFRLLTSD